MSTAYEDAVALLNAQGATFKVHEHVAVRTVAEAREHLPFPAERFLKTMAFCMGGGAFLLAGLRGPDRIDYGKLAAAAGARRADLAPLRPEAVGTTLGCEPGSVGPLALPGRALVLFDQALPEYETVFCGIGRADRTLEVSLPELVALTGARVAGLARAGAG